MLIWFWCGGRRHSRRSERRETVTVAYSQFPIFEWKRREVGRRREGRASVRKLSWRVDGFAVQMDLPVFYVIPGVTVRTIAMVLHFFIKPNSFPRPCLRTPVFVRSVYQRLHRSLVRVTTGYAADVSIWNFVRCAR